MEVQKLTTKAAIVQVLSGSRKPMRVPAIIAGVLPLHDPELKGKTPGQQVYSLIYSEAKRPTASSSRPARASSSSTRSRRA